MTVLCLSENYEKACLVAIGSVIWTTDASGFFGTALSRDGRTLYRLVVEMLPSGNGWDWSVWRAGDVTAAVGQGVGFSRAGAQASAEEAARAWDAANQP
jgi:hypothetical protein